MSCSKCGCSPCQCQSCDPGVLNQPRIFNPQVSGGQFQNGDFQSPSINGGTSQGQSIIGATIDCTTVVCQQPVGSCNAGIASTAFVCVAIQEAVSSLNPAFCTAVEGCIANASAAFCDAVATCINNTNNIINTTQAFGPSARASTTSYGVVRYATQAQILNAQCSFVMDPCTLAAALSGITTATPFGMAFQQAVNQVLGGGSSLCANVLACGTIAPVDSPNFTGIPTAPTAAPGTNTNQIATTAFVQQELTNAISSLNAAFCAAVSGCGGGGGGGGAGVYAEMTFDLVVDQNGGNFASLTTIYSNGVNCTQVPYQSTGTWPCVITFNFDTPLPNGNYTIQWQIERIAPLAAPCQNLQGGSVIQTQNQIGTGWQWFLDPLIILNCGGPPCSQHGRIHVSVNANQGAIPCALISNSWPAAGVNLPGGVRLLASDCQSYTVAEALGSGLTGVNFAVGRVFAGISSVSFTRGCTAVPAGAGYNVTFSAPQPDTNYAVTFGGGDFLDSSNFHWPVASALSTLGFTISYVGQGPGFNGGQIDFQVSR